MYNFIFTLMGRQKNDGRGRIGGRAKGTPNKPKPEQLEPLNEWLTGLIDRNRARFETDLEQMEPAQRAGVLASLMVHAQQVEAAAPQD